ncbi:hypothetical protein X895_1998 [Burkholderia pseudomallei MSHR4503]|nr:hypothetical protein X895_1998 [Burkholderia pseudomallei MSHR4503]ONC78413.1 hypothetical protein AQ922_03530 [Burkholderia pseudomallei]
MYLLSIKLWLPPTGSTTRTSSSKTGMGSFTDQNALELSQCSKYANDRLAVRTARAYFITQALKRNTLLFQFIHHTNKSRQIVTKSVQAPNHKSVPGPQRAATLLPLRTPCRPTTGDLLIDDYTPGSCEGVPLEVKILVSRGSSRVADSLIH